MLPVSQEGAAKVGVSLSLEGTQRARGRGRGGQHTRTAEDQACLDALAALLRSDVSGAGRHLSKVSQAALSAHLLPAARALVRASELVLASGPAAARSVELDYVLSPACLLGRCQGTAGSNPCLSSACRHACHDQPAGGAAPAGQPSRARRSG